MLVLGHLTTDLRDAGSDVPVANETEARAALAAFLAQTGEGSPADPADVIPDGTALAAGRELLVTLLDDDSTAELAGEYVDDPPDDDQMSIELAIGAAVVLGLLITWLQTKIDIKISREGGETSWSFELHKDATDPETIKEVASTVAGFVGQKG